MLAAVRRADRKTRRNELLDRTCISDRLGDQTIDVIETNETKGLNGSWTRSTRKMLANSSPGYRPKCVSVLACVPLWRWAFLLFELYGRGTRGRPECVSGMAGQALRHNG